MLKETKLALRVSATVYDAEIARLILAGEQDLILSGIPVSGIEFTFLSDGYVTDESTITYAGIIQAIICYVRCYFGSPSDFDRLKAAYDEQKAQLRTAKANGGDTDG